MFHRLCTVWSLLVLVPLTAWLLLPGGGSFALRTGTSTHHQGPRVDYAHGSGEFLRPNASLSGSGDVVAGVVGAVMGAAAIAGYAGHRHNHTYASNGGERSSYRMGLKRGIMAMRAGGELITSGNKAEHVAKRLNIPIAPPDLGERRRKYAARIATGESTHPPPENDLLLRVARGEVNAGRTPKWIMRQAGRYLPEYQEILKQSDFFSVCHSPSLAAEVTIQPIHRYPDLDAAIIFSDILVIPEAMGMRAEMLPQTGPKFHFSVDQPADLAKLDMHPDVESKLGYVFDAIHWTTLRLENKVPVIGFCGAPWTLMCYMVEGGSPSREFVAKKWLYQHPEASRTLLHSLAKICVEYLVGQYDAGAQLLMVFETNAGDLPPGVFEEFCVPELKFIAEQVKQHRPQALLTVFPKDADLSHFEESAYNVVGVSWKNTPEYARKCCPSKTLQGNLDPFALHAPSSVITKITQDMMARFGSDRHIANLGHGMMPSHDPESLATFIKAVGSWKHGPTQ